ncbi:MAG: hypothetical protein IPO25_19835 [Saprospiraceae bacterium]|nr:hypothetical protein [Saprospiraceae bacterium]
MRSLEVLDLLINKTLGEAMQKNLEKVGGVSYTEEEKSLHKNPIHL